MIDIKEGNNGDVWSASPKTNHIVFPSSKNLYESFETNQLLNTKYGNQAWRNVAASPSKPASTISNSFTGN